MKKDNPIPHRIRAPRYLGWLVSPAGRAIRVAFGLVLVSIGLFSGMENGWVLALIGLVPIATGLLDLCLTGPAFHASVRGSVVRKNIREQSALPPVERVGGERDRAAS